MMDKFLLSRKSSLDNNHQNGFPYMAKAILTYTGEKDRMDILSFCKGEELMLLGEFQYGWFIAKRDDMEGFVPSKYFLKTKTVVELKPKKKSQLSYRRKTLMN
eukprot:TRINITY_DN1762_c0_g1_i2.p1 TRINITY_DN1762_c0_g1~~TRINITY_DN1762_c0_g1_i2.p1  ORF type:complete len:103 (-),score=21.92 TRINITY_DN1762_c0_g1_i2:26-334(-)